MSIVSYAQNFEDVMLWRALGHVTDGLYVDVGAQHPSIDSVSMAFHEAGWQGIHIEPVPAYAEMLRQARPGDTVLQVALGAVEGTLELHVIDDSGLSTALDEHAERHEANLGVPARRLQVPMLTLTSALRHLNGRPVHWLKIDVEGFEEQVLRGWDSATLRPWILVVEATKPGSPEADFAAWDPLVTAAAYRFVYFDGLNRFYVAEEHAELANAFAAPPNVFDGAQLSGAASAAWCLRVKGQAAEAHRIADKQAVWLRNEWDAAAARSETLSVEMTKQRTQLEAAMHEQREQLQAASDVILAQQRDRADAAELLLAARNAEFDAQLAALERVQAALDQQHAALDEQGRQSSNNELALQGKVAELQHWSHHWYTIAEQREAGRQALIGSTSWRMTAPLRRASKTLQQSRNLLIKSPRVIRQRGAALAPRAVRWAVRRVLANQWMSQMARGILASHPALKARLRSATVAADIDERASANGSTQASQPSQLSQYAGRLYSDMRKAANKKDQ